MKTKDPSSVFLEGLKLKKSLFKINIVDRYGEKVGSFKKCYISEAEWLLGTINANRKLSEENERLKERIQSCEEGFEKMDAIFKSAIISGLRKVLLLNWGWLDQIAALIGLQRQEALKQIELAEASK